MEKHANISGRSNKITHPAIYHYQNDRTLEYVIIIHVTVNKVTISGYLHSKLLCHRHLRHKHFHCITNWL